MILSLDIGNSHIFGGVFKGQKLLLRFRHPTYHNLTSDQLGTFLKSILRENDLKPESITAIALASVVPSIDYSLNAACKKYFKHEPFVLDYTQATTIKIKTNNPQENGADILAGVIAAADKYPKKDLLVIDLGTVTTIAALTKNQEYLGVTFIPGIKTAMNSLEASAAGLSSVEIIRPLKALGRSTTESIQAGLFFGHLGAIKEITARVTKEVFKQTSPFIVATGGFAHLYKQERFFNYFEPDLVLEGIRISYEINCHK